MKREEYLTPCGSRITVDGRGMHDESGCPTGYFHTQAVEHLAIRDQAIQDLHKPNHEGFISRCQYDGEKYPCMTLRVGAE